MKATKRAGYRPAKVLLITAFLVVVGGGSALAHYVYQKGEVWRDPAGYCLTGRAEISHGIGYGYSATDAWSYKPGVVYDPSGGSSVVPCAAAWSVAPHYLSAKNYLEKKNSAGSYVYCNEDGTIFNSTTASHVQNKQYWESAGTAKWCGSGTYRTRGYVSVLFNGARRYGNILSGAHTLPA